MNLFVRPSLVLCLLALTAAAAADEPQPTPTPAPAEYRHYSMGQITVTDQAPSVETVDLEVVTAEEITAQNARTVAEALLMVPGIRVSTGRKSEPNVSIHGFDQSKILVLVDGVPYYETNYGKLDLNQIPTANVARIEVSKGAASVLYGANAMGGVVNIVTKEAAEQPFTSGTVEIGDNRLGVLAVTHGQRHGKLSYWLNYSHQDQDAWQVSGDYRPVDGRILYRNPSSTVPTVLQGEGERTNSDVDRDAVWAKLGWDSGPDAAYWVNLHWLDMSKGLPPASDQVTVFQAAPAFSQLGRMPDYRDSGVDFDLRQRLAERLVLKGKLFYHDHQDHYDSYRDLAYREQIARSTFKDALFGGAAILESPLNDWNTLRLSLNYKQDAHRERDDQYLPFAETASYTGSAGVEDELRLADTVRLVVGVSFDWFDVAEAERNVLSSSGDYLRQDPLATPAEDTWNPVVGLNWSLGPSGQLVASLGRKSRFPLLSQLYSSRNGNPDLVPEQSTNLVVGYERALTDAVSVEATGFWYDVSDLISRSGTDPNNVFQNYAEVDIGGVELGAALTPVAGLLVRADVTWTDATDRSEGRVTDAVLNVPQLAGSVAVRWQLPWFPARLDLDGTYMDDVYTSLPSARYPNDPMLAVDAVFLTNARFGWNLLPQLELWGAVRNLLDEDYESEYAYPGPGRALSLGLSAKL